MNAGLDAGFADPVVDAQRSVFRAILDAMSHPGQIAQVSGVTAPPPLRAPPPHRRCWLWWTTKHPFGSTLSRLRYGSGSNFIAALQLWPTPDMRLRTGAVHCRIWPLCPPAHTRSPETSATVICQIESFAPGGDFPSDKAQDCGSQRC